MDSDHNNFQALRRLLALKRYEQPPPGYFESFSHQVILRIQAAQTGSTSQREGWVAWVQNLLTTFESRPALAGAFGFAVCASLATGFLSSDGVAPTPLIAGSDAFEVPYQLPMASTHQQETNFYKELQRTSLFDEMRQTYPQAQLVNWRQ